jgi:hypothetical protein
MDEQSLTLHGFTPAPRDIIDVSISVPSREGEKTDMPAERPKLGAPSTYSQGVAEEICERVAAGEPVRVICRTAGMPSRATIYRWLIEHPDFERAYAAAMQCRIEDMADECLEIADDGSRDTKLDESGDVPSIVVDQEVIARTKIRLAERHWWLACMAPRKYGRLPADAAPAAGTPGDGAKEVNPKGGEGPSPTVIEEHPLHGALRAWSQAAA